jgi:hypothetical protein
MIMLKIWSGIFAVLAVLAGCVSIGPQAGGAVPEIQGTPGKAVIYLVRSKPDLTGNMTTSVMLDRAMIGSTQAGTYFRLEVAPGPHRISGMGSDGGAISLDVQSDRVYFVEQTVAGHWREASASSFFRVIDEARARAAMAGAVKAG